MTDSQVKDALHDERALERVLQALGCDPKGDVRNGGLISCPMPDHPDNNPSCVVRASQGLFACQSLCDVILPADLVIAHGHASDRAEAMKWLEDVLGLEKRKLPPMQPTTMDPSLTVAQYLGQKGLPAWIADRFELEDVKIWQAGANHTSPPKGAGYVTDWYSAVFMPNRSGRKPRVRANAPGTKVKWAPKVRFLDGRFEDYGNKSADATQFEYPPDVIGFDQLEAVPPSWTPVLIVVEGESDVHALHAMGMTFCIGVPGSQFTRRVKRDMLHAAIKANGGDTDLSELTVVVWQEPGSAGAKFPKDVARDIADAALEEGFAAPKFVTLPHTAVPTAPKDPCALLLDRPIDTARRQFAEAVIAALPQAGVAATIATPGRAPAQPALDVLQVDGHATVPPDTELPLTLPPGWSAEAVAAQAGAATSGVEPPSYMEGPPPARKGQPEALWDAFEELEDPPAKDKAPGRVEGISAQFIRTAEGWSMEKIDKDGDATFVPICSAFVVEQVERCSDEILVRIAAPFGGAWNRVRLGMGDTADAGRTCAALGKVGVVVANRQRPSVTDLLLALTRKMEQEVGAVEVPAGTGWSGRPGTSQFGGIEVEPVNDFGARMFDANHRRRDRRGHTDPETGAEKLRADAGKWWREGVMPLVEPPSFPYDPSHVAPVLALGAAAAAPLVGPLAEVGVAQAPVVWIAGLGGGGKSVTQKLAASIFAPSLPDLDGQTAFFANANISQAALSARVDSCRDLPLTLDDVTQLPPLPGSTSRGEAAKIEAAAALGMMVFNRKPIERATRDGGVRQTRAFRSTAIFSAEVSMSSESSKAVVTAGHRRRISTIEAQPMSERGLDEQYAEHVNELSATIGGSAGELLVARHREIVAARELRAMYDKVRRQIGALEEAGGVTLTQRETLSMIVLGYGLLAEVCGCDYDATIAWAVDLLRPYLAAGAAAGGATRDTDLAGVETAIAAIDDMLAAHPLRFDSYVRDGLVTGVIEPTMGYLGKEVRPLHDGTRRVVMLRAGMDMLESRYGITAQVVEQAISAGKAKRQHQIRVAERGRARGTCWHLPPHEIEEDVDPTVPVHDPDPYGLAREVHVPGAGVATPEVPMPLDTVFEDVDRTDRASLPGRDAFAQALLESMQRGDDRIQHYTDDEGADQVSHFGWGSGTYRFPDGPAARANVSILKRIGIEARHELEALQLQYRQAYETAVNQYNALVAEGHEGLHVPAYIEVADVPPEGDPRWEVIDGIGQEPAREQWKLVQEALYNANHSDTDEAKDSWHVAHVKHYRVHIMCRMRHPEWFIVGTDVA